VKSRWCTVIASHVLNEVKELPSNLVLCSGVCFVALGAPRNDRCRLLLMMNRQYYVYLMTNRHNTVLYTGVTNNLKRRVYEHKEGLGGGFTGKYKVNKLVYFESTEDVYAAISREKQIKGGSRRKKIDLVNSMNPEWEDLYDEL